MNTTHSAEPLTVQEIRPGIFQIFTAEFTATTDAEAYIPDVRVVYPSRPLETVSNPIYSRDEHGIIRVSADGHWLRSGEDDAVRALFAAADAYFAEQSCSCGYRRTAVAR